MVMPAAVGPLSCAEVLMADALKRSTTFTTWITDGHADPVDDRIHFELITRPDPTIDHFERANLIAARPLTVIWPEDFSIRRIASNTPQTTGRVRILFEDNYGHAKLMDPAIDEDKEVESIRWWKNTIGVSIQEAFAASHDDHFNMFEVSQFEYWTRSLKDPETPVLGCTFLVEWGPRD